MYAYLWQPKVPYVWSCCCVSHLRFCIIPYCVRPRPLLNSPLCPRCPYSDSMPGGNESVRFFPPDIVFRLSMLLLDSTKGDIFSKTNRQILFLSFLANFYFGSLQYYWKCLPKMAKIRFDEFFWKYSTNRAAKQSFNIAWIMVLHSWTRTSLMLFFKSFTVS